MRRFTVLIAVVLFVGAAFLFLSSQNNVLNPNSASHSSKSVDSSSAVTKTTSVAESNSISTRDTSDVKQTVTPVSPVSVEKFSPFNSLLFTHYNLTLSQAPVCGDGVCYTTESHESCPTDCIYYDGVREKEGICGDYICATQEKQKGNCCIDCGCGVGKVCNFNKITCQTALPPFSQSKINELIKLIAKNNSIYLNYTLASVEDDVLGEKPVKVITLKCPNNVNYTCYHLAIINQNGEIVNELDTV